MKSRKKYLRLFIFLILILNLSLNLLISSPALAQYFTITKFHSDITIQKDSSFIVHETIEVKFHRPRRGIYREVPFKYRDEFGKTITTPTTVLAVKDESGKSWKYQVRKAGSLIHIRIGDPKRFVSGNQTYVITYEVENAILFLNDHDELYWNVTGNYWQADIVKSSADVSLATTQKSKNLWAAGFTGTYGSKASECEHETNDNKGRFIAKKSLVAGEGLTVAFGWDKGLVSPPSSWKKLLWMVNFQENKVFLFPIVSFLLMLNLWYRKGRDPRVREAVTVAYEPPKIENRFLTPAEVGTLLDERLDSRDITSTIVGLAVKGYIQIEEVKKEGLLFDRSDYYLKKIKESDGALGSFEAELMTRLFSFAPSRLSVSSLKNKFYKDLPSLKKTLYGELVKNKYFLVNPEKVRNLYFLTGFLIIVIGGFVLALFSLDSMWKGFIASGLTGLPIFFFGWHMPAKTRAGVLAYMAILGFQEFMNRAEKDRLERMGDKDLFSKFLPYAIALDVADNWAEAFEGIYQEPPNWYVSPGGFRTFHPIGFTRSINTVTSSLGSAIFSAPRGSGGGGGGGFGGGGGSGGGFGGGGGGSW
ncbi:MAG: DUF2207 domain-containing protein [Deltaproteobacteria bacterium]|nr:DUF2207 domain-containing protein [Deltaproteobacteria bacterium]